MSRADGKRHRGAQAQKAERQRVKREKKQGKRDKHVAVAPPPPEEAGLGHD